MPATKMFMATVLLLLALGGVAQAGYTFDLNFTLNSKNDGSGTNEGTVTGVFTTSDLNSLSSYSFSIQSTYFTGTFMNGDGSSDQSDMSGGFPQLRVVEYSPNIEVLNANLPSVLTASGETIPFSDGSEFYANGNDEFLSGTITPAAAAVPEPASFLMTTFGLGAVAFVGMVRRRRAKA